MESGSWTSVPDACCRSVEAFRAWSGVPRGTRARTLHALADALDGQRSAIIAITAHETALHAEELAPEFARMVETLRLFADAVNRGIWHVPAIDTMRGDGASIGPDHDIRRTLVPLGPVAVFGASNFPLAYGVCGGDTASALAAGCSVVVKEHPAHPRTGRLLATIARRALFEAAGYDNVIGYVVHEDPSDFNTARSLVQHESIAAVGFTGSLGGGVAIDALCRSRVRPIPAFCEMGSVNPVIIMPDALRARPGAIADALAASILMRHGQQCTRPGLILAPGECDALASGLRERIAHAPARDMLAPWIRDGFVRRVRECAGVRGVRMLAGDGVPHGTRAVSPVLLEADSGTFRGNHTLREEVFGPCTLLVRMHEETSLPPLPESLTGSIYFDNERDPCTIAHVRSLVERVGRVIFNGVPTGVRVAPGMVHSGPYPSCNRPDSTAVGTHAIARWCRPVCFQNCPDSLLPEELRDGDGSGMTRLINNRHETK